MVAQKDVETLMSGTVYSKDGTKLGAVGQVYVDDQSGQPEWMTVRTGMFGFKETFVPLTEAETKGADITVPYDENTVKRAPTIDADDAISPGEEDALYRHYGLPGPRTTATQRRDTPLPTHGQDTSGQTTDEAMTRSIRQRRGGTPTEPTGTARLRKYVIPTQRPQTIPRLT